MKDKLTVLFYDGTTYTDVSQESDNYIVDTFSSPLDAVDDQLLIGFDKPVFNLYAEMSTANTNAATLSIKYYVASFTAMPDILDETKAFTRSGFISWDKDKTISDWEKSTINGEEKYWIEITSDVAMLAGTALAGLKMVFANDNDLKEEYPNIVDDFIPTGDTTFIRYHQAVTRDIIQKLRNQGRTKVKTRPDNAKLDGNSKYLADITIWDLLDVSQLRIAAKFLALSKIFFACSDDIEDKWLQLADRYNRDFEEAFGVYLLTLDTDDDGTLDRDERGQITISKVLRV
jgi:hypothetical protein